MAVSKIFLSALRVTTVMQACHQCAGYSEMAEPLTRESMWLPH